MHGHAAPHPDQKIDRSEPRAVVGWSHRVLPMGIELTVQSGRSLVGLENGQVESCHLCMTQNQALLLARYLLLATGQSLPDETPKRRKPLLRRMFAPAGDID